VVVAARGDTAGLDALRLRLGAGGWHQVEHAHAVARAVVERETTGGSEAVAEACEAVRELIQGGTSEMPTVFAEAVDCAFAAGDIARVEQLLATVDDLKPAQLTPLLDAEATRARARLAAHRTELETADELFRRAIGLFRELGTPFYLARAQLEYAELRARSGQDGGASTDEALAVFEALAATPWLERARRLEAAVAA
jgi:hypothetical protein